jgi:hypothetical protein
MDFLPDQIRSIEQIAERVYRKIHGSNSQKPEHYYHTIPEIRGVIQDNLLELSLQLGQDEFSVDVLRHFVKKLLPLRSGDKELICNQPRIDNQILNAISRNSWPASPFVPTGRISHYRLFLQ